MREARCAKLPYQTSDSLNCSHDPLLMREAKQNRVSRQSVRGKYSINIFGSISAYSCIFCHYCGSLNIKEEKDRQIAMKTSNNVGSAKNCFVKDCIIGTVS